MSAQRAGWFLFKWLVVPVSLGAFGYYVIGPNIGRAPSITKLIPARLSPQPTTPSGGTTSTASEGSKPYEEPEVEVQVSPSTRRLIRRDDGFSIRRDPTREAPKPRRRKKRRQLPPEPADVAPEPEVPSGSPEDDGGSAGGAGVTGGDG